MKRKHLICKWQGILFALLWAVSLGTFAQTITVRGTVVDDTGFFRRSRAGAASSTKFSSVFIAYYSV